MTLIIPGIDIGELLGKKGLLEEFTDYWDLATSFELNVIQRMYKHANRAALCMFKFKPQNWLAIHVSICLFCIVFSHILLRHT